MLKRLLIPLVILVALGGAAYAYVINRQVTVPLSGVVASRAITGRRPVAVTIDNFSPDARPQSGLSSADLVFETLAEGGITRFMAVYQTHDAQEVGPVRSTRLYFNHWAAGLKVIFGHDGGNVDALHELPKLTDIYNEDADQIHGPFSRTRTRAVPHNEYTSIPLLRSYASLHGGSNTASIPAIPRKQDAALGDRPASFTLTIQFSSPEYNVSWQYDRASNDYLRSQGGTPDVEATTGKQLSTKNIVVMYTTETAAYDPFTPGAIHLATEGSNRATIYRDGIKIEGTWSKPSVTSPLRWLDTNGNPIPLDVGQTWIEVVPLGTPVTPS